MKWFWLHVQEVEVISLLEVSQHWTSKLSDVRWFVKHRDDDQLFVMSDAIDFCGGGVIYCDTDLNDYSFIPVSLPYYVSVAYCLSWFQGRSSLLHSLREGVIGFSFTSRLLWSFIWDGRSILSLQMVPISQLYLWFPSFILEWKEKCVMCCYLTSVLLLWTRLWHCAHGWQEHWLVDILSRKLIIVNTVDYDNRWLMWHMQDLQVKQHQSITWSIQTHSVMQRFHGYYSALIEKKNLINITLCLDSSISSLQMIVATRLRSYCIETNAHTVNSDT